MNWKKFFKGKKKEQQAPIQGQTGKVSDIKSFFNKREVVFIKDLILFSVAYGIPINYMLWGIFDIPFGIFTFPAYGFLFYLIKMEFPDFWRKLWPERR